MLKKDILRITPSLPPKYIAKEMNILPDSLVFVDDNPAEREIVRTHAEGVAVPEIGSPEQYIRVLDHNGYFEVTSLSEDDRKRNEMYQANARRAAEDFDYPNLTQKLCAILEEARRVK